MNRRHFFSTLLAGLATAPLVAKAASDQAPDKDGALVPSNIPLRKGFIGVRPGCRHITDIPLETGKVNCMALFGDHVFIGCDNGLWTISTKELK